MPPTSFDIGFSPNPCPRKLGAPHIGDHKYWLMTHWDEVDLDSCPDDYVLNRARLYRDRRDFVIQLGDTGRPEDYPANPAR